VSKALHFKHEVPVTVRFSANPGIPKIADADPRAAPNGLAIKLRLPDGSDTDLVTHSYNGFPAKNAEEFQQFFLAIAGSKPGVPSPTPIEAFQETHPAAIPDHAGSAASELRDDHLLRREQLQVRQRKGRCDDWALSAGSQRGPTFLVEGRERQGGDELSRRRDSPARCLWTIRFKEWCS
jgi:hypothetical protein